MALLNQLDPEGSAQGRIFPFQPDSITQAFGRAVERAGIKKAIRLHDCRREAISRFVEVHGLTVAEVQQFSGHRDQRTLEEHYLRPSAGATSRKVAKLHASDATLKFAEFQKGLNNGVCSESFAGQPSAEQAED
jgi:integrase